MAWPDCGIRLEQVSFLPLCQCTRTPETFSLLRKNDLPACFLCLPHPSSRPWPWGPAARGCQDWLGLSPHPRPGGRCPTPSGRSQCGHSLTSWLLPTPHRPALDFKGPSLRQNLLRRHARDNSPRVHCHLNVLHSFNTHSHRRFQELITQRPRLGPA